MSNGRRLAFFITSAMRIGEYLTVFKTILTWVFYDNSMDIHTPRSLKLDTILTDPLYLRKLITICLHSLWFSFIPRADAKAEISFSTNGILKLREYLGIIFKAEVSSENLILPAQSLTAL